MNRAINIFILCILTAALSLSAAANIAFAEEEPQDDRQMKGAVLTALGILDGSMDYEQEITRQEFAQIVARFIEDNAGAGTEEDGGNGVSVLINMGCIVGYEDGTYRLEDIMASEEAVKILVTMLGYWYPAEQKGGYPAGYLAQAAALGITDNVKLEPGAGLTGGVLIDMLYNTLDIEVMGIDYNGFNIVTQSGSGTLLSVYRDIYKERGVVTSNMYTSLRNSAAAGRGVLGIDNVLYGCDLDGADGYIGLYVDFYFREDSDGSRQILYIERNKRNNELIVLSEDIIGKEGDSLRYYDGNREKRVSVDFGAGVIINNVFAQQISESDFCPAYGSVRFIDADGGGSYETVIIEDIELAVVGTASASDGRIFDKYTKEEVINLNDYDYVEVICEGTAYSDLSMVKTGDVAEIKRAGDGSFVTVVICREILSGVAERILLGDHEKYITVDAQQHIVSEYAARLIEDSKINIMPGSGYQFFLNTRGQIVGSELIRGSQKRYGYIMSVRYDIETEGCFIKMLDQGDEKLMLDMAETFRIDGAKHENYMQEIDALNLKNALEKHLVIYTVNLSGEITSIDTEEKGSIEGKESLVRLNTVENTDYRKFKSGIGFGGKVLVNDDIFVFVIPTADSGNENDYDFYRVYSGADFIVNGKYSLTGYNSVGYEFMADAVVLHDSGNKMTRSPYDKKPMFVNSVGMMVDEDGDVKIKLDGYIDGVETEVGVIDNREPGENTPKLSAGDVVDLVESNNGDVIFGKTGASSFLVDMNAQGEPKYLYTGTSSYSSTYLYRFKGVHRADGKYLELGDPEDMSNDAAYELIDVSNAVILVYDDDVGRFVPGTENDIITYESSPGSYSKVFLLSSNSFCYLAVYNV